jgi:hypothetical protein
MFLGLIGLAIAFDNLWLLLTLVPFALVIRYGVVAREEAYLERKLRRCLSGLPLARAALAVATARSVGRQPGVAHSPEGCTPTGES